MKLWKGSLIAVLANMVAASCAITFREPVCQEEASLPLSAIGLYAVSMPQFEPQLGSVGVGAPVYLEVGRQAIQLIYTEVPFGNKHGTALNSELAAIKLCESSEGDFLAQSRTEHGTFALFAVGITEHSLSLSPLSIAAKDLREQRIPYFVFPRRIAELYGRFADDGMASESFSQVIIDNRGIPLTDLLPYMRKASIGQVWHRVSALPNEPGLTYQYKKLM